MKLVQAVLAARIGRVLDLVKTLPARQIRTVTSLARINATTAIGRGAPGHRFEPRAPESERRGCVDEDDLRRLALTDDPSTAVRWLEEACRGRCQLDGGIAGSQSSK